MTGAEEPGPVILSVLDGVPKKWVEELQADLKAGGVSSRVEVRPQGPMAGIVWLLGTSAVLFVVSHYLAGIAQEAGKDTYHRHLKPALRRFAERVDGLDVTWMTSSSGKLPPERPGPLTIGIGPTPGRALRFVFPDDDEQYLAALEALFQLIETGDSLDRAHARFNKVSGGDRHAWKLICRYFGSDEGWMLYAPITGQRWELVSGGGSGPGD